jgi:hypothetical protein
MPESLSDLQQISDLEDFRAGSISGTGGRCGNSGCHCHREGDPAHRPHLRLTYKVNGRTVTESFATPAEQRKAEREIETFRRYRQLERPFVEINDKICRARPLESAPAPEKKNGRSDSGGDHARGNQPPDPYLR